LKNQIIHSLIDSSIDGNTNPNDVDDFVDCICSELNNTVLKLNGDKKQIRFHPIILKVAYNIYPYLKSKKSEVKINHGQDFALYALHSFECFQNQDTSKTSEPMFGQICCDEMKVKSGLVWRSSNHELVGFANDLKKIDEIISEFVLEKENDKLETYINQWLYRSIKGLCFPCNFFYNDSHLNAYTLFNQFKTVVEGCESIDRMVFALSFDAGGSNTSLLNAFREWQQIPDNMNWLDLKFISIPHPIDPS
jgi:hypothetical protein